MKKLHYILLISVLFVSSFINLIVAQQFTDEITLGGMGQGSVAWGDYDNDGFTDVLISGLNDIDQATILYHNNGDNTFTDSGISFTGVYNGSAAWGDCDNDGDLDLLITGTTAFTLNALSKIYRNNGDGTFTEITSGLPGIYRSSVSWGDVDRDGDLDILMTGMTTNAERVSRIYLNDGTGKFTLMQGTSFIPVFKGCSSFGDIDNDGYPDVFLTGETAILSRVAKVYRNNKNGTFSELTNVHLTGLAFASCSWSDLNNDGYLDLIVSGEDSNFAAVTNIYINDKNGGFTEQIGSAVGGVKNCTVSCGDYDNDGDLDLFLSGERNNTTVSEIYTNNGAGIFTVNSTISIIGTKESSSGFCDYNNDGKLDLLIAGMNSTDALVTKIYKNNNTTANNNPGKPLNLSYEIDRTNAHFNWNRVSGDETPSNSLSYNVRVGFSPTSTQVISPQSDNTGKRNIVSMGNIQLSNSLDLKNIRWNTDYYASVQAIDNSFAGGPFSDPVTFKILPKQPTKMIGSNLSTSSILLKWERGNGDRCILFAKEGTSGPSIPVNNTTYFANSYYGDGSPLGSTGWYCIYKGEADSVILTGLNPEKDYTVHAIELQGLNGSEMYATEINPTNDNLGVFSSGIFTPLSGISMTGLGAGSVSWGDYDNDGFLDILSTGQKVGGTNVSKIYHNNGNNTFTEQTSITIEGVAYGSSAWGDYNNDDLLDFVLTGYNQSLGAISRIYKNNGDNSFTWMENISLVGVTSSSVSWADYDNDGDLDLLITGQNLNTGVVTKLYRNDGNDTFTEQTNTGLKPVYRGSVAWGDYDNDGLPDILLTGSDGLTTGAKNFSAVYKNNGDGTFTEQTGIELTDVCLSSVTWGDYNNDNYLDILLTGASGIPPDYRPVTKVYRNNRNNTFTELTGSSLTGISMSSAEWGDYNNDGLLDILLTGYSENNLEFKIYLNNGNNGFSDLTALKIPGAYYCNTSSADYDNDGDLDILFTGNTGTFTSQIYRNNLYMKAGQINPNMRPEAPSVLKSEVTPRNLKLTWTGVKTDETFFVNMSYNIRCKLKNDPIWTVAPQASTDGYRSLNDLGNAQLNRSYTIKDPVSGKYFWQVQAVDQSFLGSEWSKIDSVIIKNTQAFFKTDTVCLGLVTHFTDQSVVTDGIASWKWDFKDGTISVIQNPVHSYASAGTFSVKLLVTSSTGDKDSLIQNVIVKNRPSTQFTAPNVCIGIATPINNITSLNGLTISSWLWKFGDGQSSSSEQPGNHTFSLKGTYKTMLKAISTNSCSDSITRDVIIAGLPGTSISADKKLVFCAGDTLTLSAEKDPLYTYQWTMDNTNYPGATQSSLKIFENSAAYFAIITNTLAPNCETKSESKTITIKPTPFKPAIISDNYKTGDCISDSPIKLKVSQSVNDYNYVWFRNGTPINNAVLPYIEDFLDQGDYIVAAELNGCLVNSDKFSVNYTGAPEKPKIFAQGPNKWYLATNSLTAKEYRWYFNDKLIDGALKYYYVADQKLGVYRVSVGDSKGCFTRSDSLKIPTDKYSPATKSLTVGNPFAGLKIYPNPSPGIFNLEMDNEILGTLNIIIINHGGKEILKIKFEKATSHFSSQIDLSGQTKGVYLVNIRLDKYFTTNQIIIE